MLAQGERHHGVLVLAGKADVLQMLGRYDTRAVGETDEAPGVIVFQSLEALAHEGELLKEGEPTQGDQIAATFAHETDIVEVALHADVTQLGDAKDIRSRLHVLGDLRERFGRILVAAAAADEDVGVVIA